MVKKKTGKCKLSKDPVMRLLQAEIEELQQSVMTFHNKQDVQERETRDLNKEIHAQKRQRTDSIGSSIATASVSRSSTGK